MPTSEEQYRGIRLLNLESIFDPSILDGFVDLPETATTSSVDYGIYSAPSDGLSIRAIQSNNNSIAPASSGDLENFRTLCNDRYMAFIEEYLSNKKLSEKINSLSSFMDVEQPSYKKIIQALGNLNRPSQEITFSYHAWLSIQMTNAFSLLLKQHLAADNLRASLTLIIKRATTLSEHHVKYLGLMYAHLAAGNRLPLAERAEPGVQQPHAIAGMNVGYR